LIVYVDVVASIELLAESQSGQRGANTLLWVSQKSLLDLLRPPVVDEVLRVHLSGHKMTSYKSLRAIIRNGQLKAKSLVKGLAKKHAY